MPFLSSRTRCAQAAIWTFVRSGLQLVLQALTELELAGAEPASGIAALRRAPAAPRPVRPPRSGCFSRRHRCEGTTVTEPVYANSYENLALTRDDGGVQPLDRPTRRAS
jgi:hypothetical protein